MSGRSVVISFFIICISIGITIMNEVNAEWAKSEDRMFIEYNITSPVNYSDLTDVSQSGVNDTYRDFGEYNKPADVTQDFGFFQGLRAGRLFLDVVFNSVWGFPKFMTEFGMPNLFVIPLAVLIILNHILTLVYIFTGKSFF